MMLLEKNIQYHRPVLHLPSQTAQHFWQLVKRDIGIG